jgi:peptide/nickel transport system ATP-binding protein
VPGKTPRGEHLGSIPGMVPSLVGTLRGCSFRERCPHASPPCAEDVAFTELGPGRAYRCVLSPEQGAANAARAQVWT